MKWNDNIMYRDIKLIFSHRNNLEYLGFTRHMTRGIASRLNDMLEAEGQPWRAVVSDDADGTYRRHGDIK